MNRDRATAMAEARRLRTCPPPDILADPDREARICRRRNRCRPCGPTAGAALLGRLVAAMPTGPSTGGAASPPAEGQLRFIRPERGGWRGEWHLNPPLVLVLGGQGPALLVAQTYPDPILAGPGDLILGANLTGLEELFVEGWNTYRLWPEDLGPPAGQAPPAATAGVRRLEADPSDYPPWALRPRPLTADDPRTEFRRLEREVAAFFRMGAAGNARPGPPPENARIPADGTPAGIREPAAEYGRGPGESARDAEIRAAIGPHWGEAIAWAADRDSAGEMVLHPLPQPPAWIPVDGVWQAKGCPGAWRKIVADALLVDPSGRVEHALAVSWDPAGRCFRAEFVAAPAGRRLVLLPPPEEGEENG